jgi:site-specific DNA-methyltransferase (adenine-specific)
MSSSPNLYVLHGLNGGMADLIYLDPPFNTKRLYSAPVGSKAASKAPTRWNTCERK